MADLLHCNVITPERPVLECDATSVVLPAHDGEMGFLKNRAPFLCKLGLGELRIAGPDGERRFFLDGGFAQMLNNELTILTDRAEDADSIDATRADQELRDALSLLAPNLALRQARDHAVARAKARRRVALRAR